MASSTFSNVVFIDYDEHTFNNICFRNYKFLCINCYFDQTIAVSLRSMGGALPHVTGTELTIWNEVREHDWTTKHSQQGTRNNTNGVHIFQSYEIRRFTSTGEAKKVRVVDLPSDDWHGDWYTESPDEHHVYSEAISLKEKAADNHVTATSIINARHAEAEKKKARHSGSVRIADPPEVSDPCDLYSAIRDKWNDGQAACRRKRKVKNAFFEHRMFQTNPEACLLCSFNVKIYLPLE
jgi:hypothetical protein